MDLRIDYEEEKPQPVGEVKTIKLSKEKSVKIGIKMDVGLEKELIECLKENVSALHGRYLMSEMDTDVICHIYLLTQR